MLPEQASLDREVPLKQEGDPAGQLTTTTLLFNHQPSQPNRKSPLKGPPTLKQPHKGGVKGQTLLLLLSLSCEGVKV